MMARLTEKAPVESLWVPLAEQEPAAFTNVPAPPLTEPFTEYSKFAAPVSCPVPVNETRT